MVGGRGVASIIKWLIELLLVVVCPFFFILFKLFLPSFSALLLNYFITSILISIPSLVFRVNEYLHPFS